MRYMVVLDKEPASYGTFAPDLPDCIAAGETEAEAVVRIQEVIELHLEDLRRSRKSIPEPVSKSTLIEVG